MLTSEELKRRLDEACIELFEDGPRTHLGASEIGGECQRKLWFKFRWTAEQAYIPTRKDKDRSQSEHAAKARMLRLFNRGHHEEGRFIAFLEHAGISVQSHDSEGKQLRIIGSNSHFGGSCDGIGIDTATKEKFLLEFKTNKSGPEFEALLRSGVRIAKPQHWAQMCTYGAYFGIRRAIYINLEKETDTWHTEVVELDWALGRDMDARASKIITARDPYSLPRLSADSNFWMCKRCEFSPQCHRNEPVSSKDIHCRNCKHSVPADNKQWYCERHKAVIPEHIWKCDEWRSVV